MRITDSMRMLGLQRSNAAFQERVVDASRRASAGQRVLVPSDDPVAYAAAVRRRATISQMNDRSSLARAAADELSIAERALDGAVDLASEARAIAVEGSNDALAPSDRKLLADRVRALREQLIQIANTRGTRGYAFAGTKTDAPAFTPAGAFAGNDSSVLVPVSDGLTPRGNASGARAFTAAGGRDVFADLSALATALDANDTTAIRGSIDILDAGHAQILAAQVDVGNLMDQFRVVADLTDESRGTIEVALARETGATDMPRILTDLASASSAYEQSMSVTRRLLSLPSLAS